MKPHLPNMHPAPAVAVTAKQGTPGPVLGVVHETYAVICLFCLSACLFVQLLGKENPCKVYRTKRMTHAVAVAPREEEKTSGDIQDSATKLQSFIAKLAVVGRAHKLCPWAVKALPSLPG